MVVQKESWPELVLLARLNRPLAVIKLETTSDAPRRAKKRPEKRREGKNQFFCLFHLIYLLWL